MKETTNFGLKKPEENEFYDVNVQNENLDEIDRILQEFKGGIVLNTSILEYALTVPNGTHFIRLGGNYHDGTDLPHSNYRYSCASIEKRSSTQLTVVLWGISADYSFKVNHYTDGVWYGWKGLSDYLPLSGGRLSNAKRDVLQIENTAEGASIVDIRFMINGVSKGQIGVSSEGNPIFYASAEGKSHTFLHTGNKPTGTYTGNGDATERTINIGGIGDALFVRGVGDSAFCIVTRSITLCVNQSGVSVLVDTQARIDAETSSMVLILKTDSQFLNKSGMNYKYDVL